MSEDGHSRGDGGWRSDLSQTTSEISVKEPSVTSGSTSNIERFGSKVKVGFKRNRIKKIEEQEQTMFDVDNLDFSADSQGTQRRLPPIRVKSIMEATPVELQK